LQKAGEKENMFGYLRFMRLSIAVLPLLAAGYAQAQLKIGVVNTQQALAETAELKKAQADLEARLKPRQEQLEKLRKELDTINQQLSLGDKLTPQAQAELSAQGSRKSRDLQRLSEDLQNEVDDERERILSRSSERMRQVLTKLAEELGLDLIMDASAALYIKPALDLTKQAAAAYDRAFPAK